MKTKKLFFLLLVVAAITNVKAQSVSCSSFCITDIQMDTLPNTLSVTISFAADSGVGHINYPYISALLDTDGDTIATGAMSFFVQFNNSSQSYSLTTSLTSIPSNFHCTAYFNYDTSVCTLSYPCADTGITCSDFCATDIQIDSAGFMAVNLLFSENDTSFITYPYISAITDTNGDTVATGALNSFGQFGNTSQTYNLTTSLNSIPANFNCTIHFRYDSEECILSYPCMPLSIKEDKGLLSEKVQVYPNPVDFTGNLYITATEPLQNSVMRIVNTMGQIVLHQKLNTFSTNITINLSDKGIAAGIYYVILETEKSKNTARFIIR
ncbi:MAG: T9SS type A sorting domain-containing protein [Bacteroidia bacterium]